MKHIRVRLTPGDETIHPLFTMLTDQEFLSSAEMVDWNITDIDEPAFLFAIEGNHDRVLDHLDSLPYVDDYESAEIDETRFYLHVWPEATPVSQNLFEMYTRQDIIIVHPVVYKNGSAYVSILGNSGDLQGAMDDFSTGLDVSVQQVGDFHSSPETVVSRLSSQQRKAVEIASELGYYEHPRQATHAEIAERMTCAPNTVSVHLQKAEAKIISAVLE